MIITCTCAHPQQDRMYGKKRRVANDCNKSAGNGFKYVRCTVCEKEHKVKG